MNVRRSLVIVAVSLGALFSVGSSQACLVNGSTSAECNNVLPNDIAKAAFYPKTLTTL